MRAGCCGHREVAMTPQEQNLVRELFDRLASLEGSPRDPDAMRLISDGLRRAPNAVYALAQTVLLQDRMLRRADGRIRELEGGGDGRGSVPEVPGRGVSGGVGGKASAGNAGGGGPGLSSGGIGGKGGRSGAWGSNPLQQPQA